MFTNNTEWLDLRTSKGKVPSASLTILQAELDCVQKKLRELKEQQVYQRTSYSVAAIDTEVFRMETGLSTKSVLQIVFNYTLRFTDNNNYYYGKVNSIKLEDQVFIKLMKLRQNYTNLYLAQLFCIKPDDSKIEAILNLPLPQNKKDVECLLGMVTCLGKFISNMST